MKPQNRNTLLLRIQVVGNGLVAVLVPAGSEHIHHASICKQKESQDAGLQCLKYIFRSVYTSVWTQRKSHHLQLCLSVGALRAAGQASQQTSASFINCKRGKQHSMFIRAVRPSLQRKLGGSIQSSAAPFQTRWKTSGNPRGGQGRKMSNKVKEMQKFNRWNQQLQTAVFQPNRRFQTCTVQKSKQRVQKCKSDPPNHKHAFIHNVSNRVRRQQEEEAEFRRGVVTTQAGLLPRSQSLLIV